MRLGDSGHSIFGIFVCQEILKIKVLVSYTYRKGYNRAVTSGADKKTAPFADAVSLSALAAFICVPFIIRAIEGKTALSVPLSHDIILQWVPFRAFIERSISEGMLPLWCPNVFAGFPFAAFSHTSTFYPFSILLHLADYARSVNVFYPFQLLVAGSGVYALCRRSGLSALPSLFAALTYSFTGKPFYFIHFLPAACSNPWMPWTLYAALSLLLSGRARHFLLVAFFTALMVLGGDVESTAYGFLFGAPLLAVLVAHRRGRIEFVVPLLAGLFMSAALCMIQLLPLLNYSSRFVRNQGVTFEYFSQRSLPAGLLWGAVAPVKGLAEDASFSADAPLFYLGLVAIVLMALAALCRKEKSSRYLFIIMAAVFLWSFGSIPLLDRVQFLLPVLSRFGSPEHAFYMGQLALAILAGRGLRIFLSGGEEISRTASFLCLLAPLFYALAAVKFGLLHCASISVLLLLCSSAAVFMISRGKGISGVRIAGVLLFAVHIVDVYGLAFTYLPKNDPDIYSYPEWLEDTAPLVQESDSRYIFVSNLGLRDPGLVYHAGIALGMDAVDGWITVPPRDYAEVMSIVDERAVVWEDGRLHRLGLNADLKDGRFIDADSMPVINLLSLRYIYDRGIPLKFSAPMPLALIGPEYHLRPVYDNDEGRASIVEGLPSGPGEIYRFRLFLNEGDILAFTPVVSWPDSRTRRADFLVTLAVDDSTDVLFHNSFYREAEDKAAPVILDLSEYAGKEVRLSLATTVNQDGGARLLWKDARIANNRTIKMIARPGPDLFLYENTEALPRSMVVHRAGPAGEEGALLKMGKSSTFELSQKIFIEDASGIPEMREPDKGREYLDRAKLFRSRPGEEVYRVSAASDGMLFVSNQYYPGWRATSGGVELRILRADHAFRAVPVKQGESIVKMSYQPADFRLGLWISLSTLVFAAVFAGVNRRKRKK